MGEQCTTPADVTRRMRISDQMVTIYSVLRDRYACRAQCLTLGIFGASVVLCTCTFLPDGALVAAGISATASKIIVGVVSSFVLFASVAELCLSWRERSRSYGEAADRVATIKALCRGVSDAIAPDDRACRMARLVQEYDGVMATLPRVPDRQFVGLKAYHIRKVRLSQMLDESAGCPVWLLRLRLLMSGVTRGAAPRRADDGGANGRTSER